MQLPHPKLEYSSVHKISTRDPHNRSGDRNPEVESHCQVMQ